MDLEIRDRAYVVTGGSRGLGFAAARCLVDEGARVVLVGRDEDRLAQARASLGDAARALAGDLADPDLPACAIALAHEAFGRIDGGVISVGGPAAGTVMSTTDDQWRAAFDSVFLGAVRCMRELVAATADRPGVTGSGGSIVSVLSTSAREFLPGLSTSNGLRPGLAMLIADLAAEAGPRNVRVNGLLPGRLDTERVRQLDEATGDAEARRAQVQSGIPLGRYGNPDEFGRAAAFLLSPAAGYVTGTVLTVDGGATRQP